jgi:hypothetical protein
MEKSMNGIHAQEFVSIILILVDMKWGVMFVYENFHKNLLKIGILTQVLLINGIEYRFIKFFGLQISRLLI